jgi:hypothetical protein
MREEFREDIHWTNGSGISTPVINQPWFETWQSRRVEGKGREALVVDMTNGLMG